MDFIRWLISLILDVDYVDLNNLTPIDIAKLINFAATALLSMLLFHKTLFLILSFLPNKKYAKTEDKSRKYAFLICARNEEKVIANLIDSIHKQDYPRENITIFVMADNCSDKTKEVALAAGAVVYERFDTTKIGKGYALNLLTANIRKDYGITAFDGFFVFDADNLLKNDYVSRMNDVFVKGHKVITSYINVKNFSTNVISGAYGYHHYRNMRFKNNPTTRLNLACKVAGTGFLFASEILKEYDWKWLSLTEDYEFTVEMTKIGYNPVFCSKAVFYDEQPVNVKMMVRQRKRWEKGLQLLFVKNFFTFFKGLFTAKRRKQNKENKQSYLQYTFSLYDLTVNLIPYSLLILVFKLLYYGFIVGYRLSIDVPLFRYSTVPINILVSFATFYLMTLINLLPIIILEWKEINSGRFKRVFYYLMFPFFDLVSSPIAVAALFSKPKWKIITHEDTTDIEQINENIKINNQ